MGELACNRTDNHAQHGWMDPEDPLRIINTCPGLWHVVSASSEQIETLDQVEAVNHPAHYGGDTVYEAIKVIEAWELGFCLGNAVKYISRAGKKRTDAELQDLQKAAWYLAREIEKRTG